ncbi:hypothetical protein [Nocardioides halotolerans]|jgi:hypothetical protein|uniref:hypothetical protein n=1 Tax=Nocardioides halotolerans TaxID=433660 RepID=UPI00040E2468|nr:hypothetical protein [Nocardioides halotolerans]
MTTSLVTEELAPARSPGPRLTTWPLWGLPAGALGFVATVFLNDRPAAETSGSGYTVTPADMADLDPGRYHLAVVLGYLSVGCLIVLAAQWRRRVESQFDWSTAAPVVSGGLLASAGALTLAYGWMGALSRYLPSAPEGTSFDERGTFVYFMLNDFSPYIGWYGVLVAGAALTWMAWRERLVSRGLGTLTAAVSVLVLAFVFVTGVPGIPALAAAELVVVSLWLALGRSPILQGENRA